MIMQAKASMISPGIGDHYVVTPRFGWPAAQRAFQALHRHKGLQGGLWGYMYVSIWMMLGEEVPCSRERSNA